MKNKLSRITIEAMVPALFLIAACVFKAMALWASDSAIRVYPNPWRASLNSVSEVRMDNLPLNSTVKIMTVTGERVRTLSVASGSVSWDLTNDNGSSVASGIYIYMAKAEDGQIFRGKIAVIK